MLSIKDTRYKMGEAICQQYFYSVMYRLPQTHLSLVIFLFVGACFNIFSRMVPRKEKCTLMFLQESAQYEQWFKKKKRILPYKGSPPRDPHQVYIPFNWNHITFFQMRAIILGHRTRSQYNVCNFLRFSRMNIPVLVLALQVARFTKKMIIN